MEDQVKDPQPAFIEMVGPPGRVCVPVSEKALYESRGYSVLEFKTAPLFATGPSEA